MKVEEEFLDVLQNIESIIVIEFRKDKSILDVDVRDAVNALVRQYEAEVDSRGVPNTPLSDRAAGILQAVRFVCEWRLGRAPESEQFPAPSSLLSAVNLVLCLKRIRKSIERWTKEGGRQGYLTFVSQYVA